MSFLRNRHLALLLSTAALAACGNGNGGGDTGTDATMDTGVATDAANEAGDDTVTADGSSDGAPADHPMATCNETFTFDMGDATGSTDPLHAAAGQARAGRIQANQIPPDPSGLAVSAPGDFVIANSRVALLIEDAGPSDLYDPFGGRPVGMYRVQDGALVDMADLNEMMWLIGRYTVATTSVSVLHDGSDGQPAVIRTVGPLAPLPFLDEFARALAPTDYSGIDVALDYELSGANDYVDVYMTFNVTRTRPVVVSNVLHAFFQNSRMPHYFPGAGFLQGQPSGSVEYVGFVDDVGVSYGETAGDGPLDPFLSVSGLDLFKGPMFVLPACAQTRRHYARVFIGNGVGLDGLTQTVANADSQTLRAVTGTVHDAMGAPVAGAHVHATSTDGATYLSRDTTRDDGTYTLHVPSASDAAITVFREGDAVATQPSAAGSGASTVDLTLAPTGSIRVTATEGNTGMPLPVRVQVLSTGQPAPSVPAQFGEITYPSDAMHAAFPIDGRITLNAPPGTYRLVVSRGYEYELSDQTVTVRAGQTTNADVVLHRVVDTTGVMCADFHIHTHRSPDAPDTALLKLSAALGDGLEIPVRSDHEFVATFEDMIQSLGMGHWAFGVPSIEFTTFTWGHFGVVPLAPNPSMINAGSFNWANRLPPAVFADVRARPDNPTIIINHPRSGTANGGYFEVAGYSADTGNVTKPNYWDDRFTAVEVFNDSDFDANRDTTVKDWFSFLGRGRRVFAVGSSDSHSILGGSPVGYPRTCMYLGTDDPRMIDSNQVRDAAATGRAYVAGGIYVNVTGPGGTMPGQDAMNTGAMATIHVNVQAASWVSATQLEVIVDGATAQTITLDASTMDPTNPVVRYDGDLQIPVASAGSYVIIVARGANDLSPVHPARMPFGATNPIFLHP